MAYGGLHLPDVAGDNRWLITSDLSGNARPWTVPRRAKFVYVLLAGGGGGGGSGFTAGSGGRGGGGGGGPAGTAAGIWPAFLLPPVLWFAIGPGAAGGIQGNTGANGSGQTGSRSFMGMGPGLVANDNRNIMVADHGSGGSLGAASGAAGAGTSSNGFIQPYGTVGPFSAPALGGVSGGTGGNGVGPTAGSNVAFSVGPTTAATLGGAGGGGTDGASDRAGGNITAPNAGFDPLFASLSGGAAGAQNPGQDGRFSWAPFYSTGGSGGGSNFAGIGGQGGNGGLGAGGGGGGGGTTGGGGGRGGDGFALIIVM